MIGDVVKGSNEADFLNGFVNQYNSLGHNGDFITFERDIELLEQAGFSSTSLIKHVHWNFKSQRDCHNFLRLLFSLDNSPSNEKLDQTIDTLGTKEKSIKDKNAKGKGKNPNHHFSHSTINSIRIKYYSSF